MSYITTVGCVECLWTSSDRPIAVRWNQLIGLRRPKSQIHRQHSLRCALGGGNLVWGNSYDNLWLTLHSYNIVQMYVFFVSTYYIQYISIYAWLILGRLHPRHGLAWERQNAMLLPVEHGQTADKSWAKRGLTSFVLLLMWLDSNRPSQML